VRDYLYRRNYKLFYAVVCTHPHSDHAAGLIKLIQDRSIIFVSAWMHDIRNHISSDSLRRARSGGSARADNVRQVVETTEELARGFRSRGIPVREPFTSEVISHIPSLVVVSPDEHFYRRKLEEFTEVELPTPPGFPAFGIAGSTLGGTLSPPPSFYAQLFAKPQPAVPLSSLLAGVLSNSSVKEKPMTQPFNDTSTVIGGACNGLKLLFTGDAGSEALDQIPRDWNNLSWMQVPHHGSDGNLSQTNIERFCPKYAYISAKGDLSHPNRAIVNGLVKVGAQVASTHNGDLWYGIGNVPAPPGYGPLTLLKGIATVGWGRL
jgi:hypothetical protein